MKVRFLPAALVTAALLLAAAVPAEAQKARRQDRNITIELTFGTVQSIESVKLGSKAAQGAADGGIAGLAAAHGDTGDNLAGAAAGAAVGALLAQALIKHKADAITVQRADGSMIKVIMDHATVIVGDCVSIEEGNSTNLRRTAPEMCSGGPHHDDEDIQQRHLNDADECHQAKLALLEADEEDAFNRALEKVKILCH